MGETVIAKNDSWSTSADSAAIAQASAHAGAFAFVPVTAFMLLTNLPSGTYTAQVRSRDGTSGIALIEVYKIAYTPSPRSIAAL